MSYQVNPNVTVYVYNPWNVPSWIISRKIVINVPRVNKSILIWWNHFTNPDNIIIAPSAPVKGQGL